MSGKHARTEDGEVFLIEHTVLLVNAKKARSTPVKALLLQPTRFPKLHIFKLVSHLSLCAQNGSDLGDVEKLKVKLEKPVSKYRKRVMLGTLQRLVTDGKTVLYRHKTIRETR